MRNKEEVQTTPGLDESIKHVAIELGADAVGIAPLERFARHRGATADDGRSFQPAGYEPQDLLPGARSIVVVALRVLNGVLASNTAPVDTTYAFGAFGYVHTNRMLNSMTFNLARHLERHSWPSLPLGPCGAMRLDRAAYDEGRTVGPLQSIFNLKRAAVLAGLGRRTRSGLIATEHHGTRVRLAAVITAAKLEGSPLLEGAVCPPSCRICSDSCPMRAIDTDGRINHVRCYSDMGRRGTTEAESLEEMARVIPEIGSRTGYLPHEHSAIDGFGNRMCRVVCMALCPLWRGS